jgi:hypothetical protein
MKSLSNVNRVVVTISGICSDCFKSWTVRIALIVPPRSQNSVTFLNLKNRSK